MTEDLRAKMTELMTGRPATVLLDLLLSATVTVIRDCCREDQREAAVAQFAAALLIYATGDEPRTLQ
jgi:hypothetical protein